MSAAVVSALLAGAAGGVLVADADRSLRRLGTSVSPESRQPPAPPLPRAVPAAAVGVAGVVLLGSVLLGLAAVVAAATVIRAVRRRSRRRAADAASESVAELLAGFAAELRAGARPDEGLRAAAVAVPRLPDLLGRATDPVPVLVAAAGDPGAAALADLATAWRVAETTGAGLAAVSTRLAESARADLAVRRAVAAELAGPRATATLLAGLPAAGVLLGTALGADPLGFLLGRTTGRACLLAGVLLVAAGTAWTDSVAARAEPG